MSGLRSLGLRSDLVVLRGVSETEIHDDRVVVRTPEEPDFWCGNLVIFRSDMVDPDPHIALFRSEFPRARHVTLAWDVPGMPVGPGHARLRALGFEIEQTDVLTLTGPLHRAIAPKGIVIRPIATAQDWAQVVALQTETGVAEGHSLSAYVPFLKRRFANRQRLVSMGWGCWFGAFEGSLLVGDLGIFVGSGVARFQDVETRSSHRRRGICAALVCAGVDWAARQDPDAVPVIVSLADNQAGRVYRRCGFAFGESLVMAIRPPDGAKTAPG